MVLIRFALFSDYAFKNYIYMSYLRSHVLGNKCIPDDDQCEWEDKWNTLGGPPFAV